MKNTIAILLLLSGCLVTSAQQTNPGNHFAGQSILSVSPTLLLDGPNGMQFAGGAKFQLFISKRFSIDGDLMISKDYFHVSPAVIGVPIVLLSFTDAVSVEGRDGITIFLIGLAAVILSVEHLSYHIPATTSLDISPFISLLRYKYAYRPGIETDPFSITDQLSFATGIQLNKYLGNFVLSPYAEYNIGYKDRISGFNAGIYFGYFFDGRNLKSKQSGQTGF
jgi:hypothetical protein